jgi:hypothetical protein
VHYKTCYERLAGRLNTAEFAKDNVDKVDGHFDGFDRKFEIGGG